MRGRDLREGRRKRVLENSHRRFVQNHESSADLRGSRTSNGLCRPSEQRPIDASSGSHGRPHPSTLPSRHRSPLTMKVDPKRRRISAEEALELWQQYRATGDGQLRDRLIMTFAPLVKYIVYRKIRELPARCEVEDFISCGLEALIASIDRYDPDKGATLEQYAWPRIHGAVLDELRRQDWAPRSVRRWERDIEKAADAFTALHRRRPTTE